eukprot:1175558-Prorocentrum_minimum.AAC.2
MAYPCGGHDGPIRRRKKCGRGADRKPGRPGRALRGESFRATVSRVTRRRSRADRLERDTHVAAFVHIVLSVRSYYKCTGDSPGDFPVSDAHHRYRYQSCPKAPANNQNRRFCTFTGIYRNDSPPSLSGSAASGAGGRLTEEAPPAPPTRRNHPEEAGGSGETATPRQETGTAPAPAPHPNSVLAGAEGGELTADETVTAAGSGNRRASYGYNLYNLRLG